MTPNPLTPAEIQAVLAQFEKHPRSNNHKQLAPIIRQLLSEREWIPASNTPPRHYRYYLCQFKLKDGSTRETLCFYNGTWLEKERDVTPFISAYFKYPAPPQQAGGAGDAG